MKKNLFAAILFFIAVLCAGCGMKTSLPSWRHEGFAQLENYKKNFLAGREQVAESHYRKALEEVKRSGDIITISKIYLTKTALHVASLRQTTNDDYLILEAIERDNENQNFYIFINGDFSRVNQNLMPPRYREFLKAGLTGDLSFINKALAEIDDPLSKLIAIGIIVNKRIYNERTLETAITTASLNGWHKPLLAYLAKLQAFYESNNQKDKAELTMRRLKAISN